MAAHRRSRRVYAAAVVATIAAGLGSRAIAAHLPGWLAKNAGDALYATMVVFALGCAWPAMATWRAAAIALVVCFAIEASQAYHAPWLDAVRATLPGRLVLGQGFQAFDLVCYVVGVALGAAIDLAIARLSARS